MIGVGWPDLVVDLPARFVRGWLIKTWTNETHRDRVHQARAQATPAQIRAWLDRGPRGT